MTGMLTKAQWQHLIPHRDAMSLLDTVIAWDDDSIELTTQSHRSAENPLRSDGLLRAVHLCEYGAQAMAVHGGLLAQRAGGIAAPGMLVSLRLLDSGTSWQYAFRVEHERQLLAEGRAAVMARQSA